MQPLSVSSFLKEILTFVYVLKFRDNNLRLNLIRRPILPVIPTIAIGADRWASLITGETGSGAAHFKLLYRRTHSRLEL